mmetsp:Transcript_71951/g.227412  ORF Transcript_71951/g.227412 Transcript_71951/m.227412 type:complete len:468 (-) Transcript_71951:471-1874(-)
MQAVLQGLCSGTVVLLVQGLLQLLLHAVADKTPALLLGAHQLVRGQRQLRTTELLPQQIKNPVRQQLDVRPAGVHETPAKMALLFVGHVLHPLAVATPRLEQRALHVHLQDTLVDPDAVHLEERVDGVVVGEVPRGPEELLLPYGPVAQRLDVAAAEEDAVRPGGHAPRGVPGARHRQLVGRREGRPLAVRRGLPEGSRTPLGRGLEALGRVGDDVEHLLTVVHDVPQLVLLNEGLHLFHLDAVQNVCPPSCPRGETLRSGQAHIHVPKEEDRPVGREGVQHLIVEPELNAAKAGLQLLQPLLQVFLTIFICVRGVRVQVAIDEAEAPVIKTEPARDDALHAALMFVGGHLKHAELVYVRAHQLGEAEHAEQHAEEVGGLAEEHVELVLVPAPGATIIVHVAVNGQLQQLNPLHDSFWPTMVQKAIQRTAGRPRHCVVDAEGDYLLQAGDDDVRPLGLPDAERACEQ